MARENFILIKVIGTVSSTRTQIINTDWIKRVYQSDDDAVVRVDVQSPEKVYTLKVQHTLREMWGKVRGKHL